MMALALLLQWIFMPVIFILFLHSYTQKCNKLPLWNFPLLGVLPHFLINFHRLHDKLAEVLERSHGSLLIKPSWFAQNDLFLTSDPANVHHIMSTNFQNYPKGPEWREKFDIFGEDGIFNSDFKAWELHRKVARALFSHQKFQQLATKTMREITQKGLVPVLEHVSEQNKEFDLKDLLNRGTFDFACAITTGYNRNFLSMEQPEVPFVKAIDDACEAIFFPVCFAGETLEAAKVDGNWEGEKTKQRLEEV
ncbi:hypothetical protein Patl1_27774 [Pistacia atlantica]|uniref:Uncharacterized protein n=1 Tax=Pistacia atlantica TaxID=434234 RepID=A0ACC1BC79_9ROSI|nr:hypothetical protein Patl1_27774 [Pistacia atlantica]